MSEKDRELIELAAKAAGIGPAIGFDDGGIVIGPRSRQRLWAPLTDDGDALRLAVSLGLLVDSDEHLGESEAMGMGVRQRVAHEADKYAATRRAIVSAAAEIGRVKGES